MATIQIHPKIKIGIIGYGRWAKTCHIPLLTSVPEIEIHAFFQRKAAPESSVKSQPGEHCTVDFPSAKHYRDVDTFLADPEVDLVLIVTPVQHYEFAKSSLLAGKHIVVEKAFTATSEQADELISLAKEKGKIITVFQNRRFDGDFLTLRKLIQDDVLGDIVDFQTHFDWDNPGWPSNLAHIKEYVPGQGMLYGLGSHTVDQVLHLFGRPETVFAVFKSHRDGSRGSAIDDYHFLVLQYAGEKDQGVVVTIKSGQISPMTKQLRFLVKGRKGSYLKFHLDIQESQLNLKPPMSVLDPEFGKEDPSRYGELTTTTMFDSSFQTEQSSEMGSKPLFKGNIPTARGDWKGYYENVFKAVRGEETLYVQPEEARDVIRLFELARDSARTGRSVPWS